MKIYAIKQFGEDKFIGLNGLKPVLKEAEGGILLYCNMPPAEDISYYSFDTGADLEVVRLVICEP